MPPGNGPTLEMEADGLLVLLLDATHPPRLAAVPGLQRLLLLLIILGKTLSQ